MEMRTVCGADEMSQWELLFRLASSFRRHGVSEVALTSLRRRCGDLERPATCRGVQGEVVERNPDAAVATVRSLEAFKVAPLDRK